MAIKTRSIDDSSEVAVEADDVAADDSDLATASLPIAIGDPVEPKELPIANLLEYIFDQIASFITQGSNVTITHDDSANTLTIASSDTDTNTQRTDEEIRDVIAAFIQQGDQVTVTHNDAEDTLTIASDNPFPGGIWVAGGKSNETTADGTVSFNQGLDDSTYREYTLVAKGHADGTDAFSVSKYPSALFNASGDVIRVHLLDNAFVELTYTNATSAALNIENGDAADNSRFVGFIAYK